MNTVIRIIVSGILLAAGMFAGLGQDISMILYLASYIAVGYPVFIDFFRALYNRRPLDENFLMTVASMGAFLIGEYHEGIILLIFFQVGELFEKYAVDRSRRSISSLVDLLPEHVNLVADGEVVVSAPEDIRLDDIIIIRPGERIPLDGIVTDGSSMVDASSITGESVPRRASAGDTVLSGCISTNGVLTVRVTSLYSDSTASRIISMIEDAYEAKSRSENFVTKFARYYTPFVVLSALLLAIIPPLVLGDPFNEWIYRALTFLVISCPCALVISVPLAFFGGIGGASRAGILVKGGNYLEALAGVDTVVFDKTGTLTEGTFDVEKIIPKDIGENELLKFAAYAEFHSNHPIAVSIRKAYGREIDNSAVLSSEEIAGSGIKAIISGREVLIGNESFMAKSGIGFERPDDFGTGVYVGIDGEYKGCLIISDRIRKDSKDAVAMLKHIGINNIAMLTGDIRSVGEHVAESLGIDSVYADLLPADKISIVEKLISEGRSVAFVGDGINDAPSLARSDVGIAMGGMGSDAAVEAADIVIMDDVPSKVPLAIKVAKKTRSIAMENIIFALGVKALFLVLGMFGYISMVEAVFADVGVSVIAILNSIRTLRTKEINLGRSSERQRISAQESSNDPPITLS
ncbi:MAG: cadmium-translocating P-type ATPase [Candidatus Methanoplasma sp.]|jgi:Cd2+/Zn2+-exporting ATPase|nr:cadmium-translocating P-type ATPase [Candidatus Methanoplasma sp.]